LSGSPIKPPALPGVPDLKKDCDFLVNYGNSILNYPNTLSVNKQNVISGLRHVKNIILCAPLLELRKSYGIQLPLPEAEPDKPRARSTTHKKHTP
jgi:hypothetical protein